MALTVRPAPAPSTRGRENLLWMVPMVLVLAARLARGETAPPPLPGAVLDVCGLALLAAGLWIRVCARQWKAERAHEGLVTDGLYALVRHPLYLGSCLIGAGLGLMLGDWLVLAAFLAVFWLSHSRVIHREERDLTSCFGESHAAYRRAVPALVPRSLRLAGVVPRRLREAVVREVDAIAVALAAALLIQMGAGPAPEPAAYAFAGMALFALAALWVTLKAEYRALIRAERARSRLAF
jgi:protein-S-isoprenylcysteine O-methyltransferase Ste14